MSALPGMIFAPSRVGLITYFYQTLRIVIVLAYFLVRDATLGWRVRVKLHLSIHGRIQPQRQCRTPRYHHSTQVLPFSCTFKNLFSKAHSKRSNHSPKQRAFQQGRLRKALLTSL
jgi:hypothetical protein